MDFKKYSKYLEKKINECKQQNDLLKETLECFYKEYDLNKCKSNFKHLISLNYCSYHKKKSLDVYIGDDNKNKKKEN